MKTILLSAILVAVALLATAETALAQQEPQFQMGFKDLAALIPDVVGEPLENERYDPINGNSLQKTTGGLMVWRKAGNITAFTDGARTWIIGPNGLQERSNSERFEWEPAVLATTPEPGTGPSGDGSETIPISTSDLPVERPATGFLIRDTDRDGLGELTVENGLDLDAIAVLTSPTSQPLVSVYIRSAESYTLKGIRDGTYLIYFSIGESWDGSRANFSQPQGFRFDKPLSFQTTQVPEGTRYSLKQVTFHSTPEGSATILPVNLEQFPSTR